MRKTTSSWLALPLLCAVSAGASAWEAKVAELWTQSGEVRFVLGDCGSQYFRLAVGDADTPHAYDMLLSALLSNRRVKVYNTNLDAFTGCPTSNTLAGSVRIERDAFE